MVATSATSWKVVLPFAASDVGRLVEMKPLIEDRSWSIGSNFLVRLPKNAEDVNVDIYPWFHRTTGQYRVIGSIASPQLNNTRQVVVYTPPSYEENLLKTYDNVIIMHDGQNLFNASTAFSVPWDCQVTINALVSSGQMEEAIVVGVYNTPARLDEYTYSYDPCYTTDIRGNCVGGGGDGDLYLDFLIDTLLPWVEPQFRMHVTRERLGIVGSSLGGLISCYGAWTRPSVFGKGGCMSSSFWWNTEDFDKTILKNYPRPPSPESFYVDSGTCCPNPIGDDHYQTLRVVDSMQNLGFVMDKDLFYYLDEGASHNELYWGLRFHYPMTALYPITEILAK
eukprot:TRINITY_DN5565_c0_g1_i2.p1 TRINITY_DN5565_c0_g1~~TRINITY_DN5565_c0_g1_i2.p1  ORF type:complete len:337 (+),score=85.87 TRINITY_DN5565_c0_g1_i2:515-1525(+)